MYRGTGKSCNVKAVSFLLVRFKREKIRCTTRLGKRCCCIFNKIIKFFGLNRLPIPVILPSIESPTYPRVWPSCECSVPGTAQNSRRFVSIKFSFYKNLHKCSRQKLSNSRGEVNFSRFSPGTPRRLVRTGPVNI